jgi:hypothetical protein
MTMAVTKGPNHRTGQSGQEREDRVVKTLQQGQDSRDRTTETGLWQDRHDDTAVTVHLGHDNGCDKGTKPPNRSVRTGKRGQDRMTARTENWTGQTGWGNCGRLVRKNM